MDAPRAARLAVAARPPSPRAPARFPFASSTAPRRAGWWWCLRDPRADSSGGGSTFPSPGRCTRLALAHRNRKSPAANLGLPPPRPPRSPAAGIGRVTGDGGCEGRPLVECAGDRQTQEPAGGQSRHVSTSLLPRLLFAVSIQCAASLADRGTRMRVNWAEFQI
jgi:adenylylsulfate kinase